MGDYLAPVPWRPVVSREALLASNDTTPAPMTLSRIARLVDDLWEVEGRFRPGESSPSLPSLCTSSHVRHACVHGS